MERQYQKSHPWITFRVDLNRLSHKAWLLLGEAASKSQHVAGVPLRPEVATQFYEVYLSKGAHGTTSIEGNTLSEEQVLERVKGELPLPPSREYLGTEIDNVLKAYNLITKEVTRDHREAPLLLSMDRIVQFNGMVLENLELEDGVVAGKIRDHNVGVARYKAPPAEDCEYLLATMVDWLNGLKIDGDEAMAFPLAVLKATLAHLYIAWIHPFGDGNGRTARLIEFQLLLQAGVPAPAAHLMSDFYNKTRDAYYRQLDRTSREPYAIERFLEYALQGFVDELREQLVVLRREQVMVTWENYVHEMFAHMDTPARRRQKHIVLDLTPKGSTPTPVAKLTELSPRVAYEYGGKGGKTTSRDVNALIEMGLIRRVRGGVVANVELIRAFLPPQTAQS